MGKGLCPSDKSWWGQLTNVGNKITSILDTAKKSISAMFSDKSIDPGITVEQKSVRERTNEPTG